MASSLAALKSLPCPAGEQCTAFQCLFKHQRDQDDTTTSAKTTEQPSAKIHSLSLSPADQDMPRKRIKVSSAASSSSTTPQIPSGQWQQSIPSNPRSMPPKKPAGEKKPVSPPPLRRQLSAKKPGQPELMPSTAQESVSIPASPSTTKQIPTPKPTPKKTETLNPRLLKKSPAGHEIRVRLVKALHEQYARLNAELKKVATDEEKKLVLSDQEVITKTLDDEQDIAIKKPVIYGNSIKNRIMTYKRMSVAQWKDERAKAIGDSQGTKPESAAPEPIVTGLTPAQEVDFLHRLVWPLEGLERYGYVSAPPAEEDIKASRDAVKASGNTEVCDRCTRRFQVFPGRREEDGALASNGTCTHHPGKVYYMDRAPGDRSKPQRKYRCCHRSLEDESGGCTTSPTHVFKTTDPKRLAAVLNFAETPPNPNVPADRAVCFDCEMGYTVCGLELIRITVVSWPDGEELLDVLVQPVGETLDLNTRYSGVTAENMLTGQQLKQGDDHRPVIIPSSDPAKPPQRILKIAPSPKAARDLLFSLISPTTPLIGHGLENDLNAARLIHPTCIDTVLLYPHKRGLPVRNGLKMLMETMLGRRIQMDAAEGTPEGHDSAEDARAAGELVRLKVRDDWKAMRLKGWYILDGEMVGPRSA
ncbi:Uu.00g101330.m01.CDS01 [Anthostomella pinea]|uniref:Uu.00g101330.m01.CDS01 n=1 Tax=Anthostomella pinea TaxID=933095 RepID=A0AAI8VD88_9PEZI|nr:Uu.00g101330.m01.CDS01 [Anthostomella pinea]